MSVSGTTTIYLLTETRGLAVGPMRFEKQDDNWESRESITYRCISDTYPVKREGPGKPWVRFKP